MQACVADNAHVALGAIKSQWAGLLATLRLHPTPCPLQQNPTWLRPIIALVAECCRRDSAAVNPGAHVGKAEGRKAVRGGRRTGRNDGKEEEGDEALSPTGKENIGSSGGSVKVAGTAEGENGVNIGGFGYSAASAREHLAVKGFMQAVTSAKACPIPDSALHLAEKRSLCILR